MSHRLMVEGGGLPTVVVWEAHPTWAPRIRRMLEEARGRAQAGGAGPLTVRECRIADDCRQELSDCPDALLAVELPAAGCRSQLELLAGLGRDFPWVRALVLVDPTWARYEWELRRLGAVLVVGRMTQLALAARVIWRHVLRGRQVRAN